MSNTQILQIDPAERYVIVVKDKKMGLQLQEKWEAFLRGGVQAIFLYNNVAVVPVEQVVGWTTWEQVNPDDAEA